MNHMKVSGYVILQKSEPGEIDKGIKENNTVTVISP